MRYTYLKGIPLIPKLLHYLIRWWFSLEIFPTCDIGKNVIFVHGGLGCVIHEKTIIEDNVKIYQNLKYGYTI